MDIRNYIIGYFMPFLTSLRYFSFISTVGNAKLIFVEFPPVIKIRLKILWIPFGDIFRSNRVFPLLYLQFK